MGLLKTGNTNKLRWRLGGKRRPLNRFIPVNSEALIGHLAPDEFPVWEVPKDVSHRIAPTRRIAVDVSDVGTPGRIVPVRRPKNANPVD